MTPERLAELEVLIELSGFAKRWADAEATLDAIRQHPLVAQLRLHDKYAGRWPETERGERESFLALLEEDE